MTREGDNALGTVRAWQRSGNRDEDRQYLGTRLAVPREGGSALGTLTGVTVSR